MRAIYWLLLDAIVTTLQIGFPLDPCPFSDLLKLRFYLSCIMVTLAHVIVYHEPKRTTLLVSTIMKLFALRLPPTAIVTVNTYFHLLLILIRWLIVAPIAGEAQRESRSTTSS
ncbi:unnamed protein product [Caenorhabditis bovis]|uniref:Uncharacterized protein n=1 Tax=Caenorhabditis bovis TaxID=2654633 RepID=A0A8S1ESM3_9PELO|nr:unnamed protein product [Caenorhabditis bovis]